MKGSKQSLGTLLTAFLNLNKLKTLEGRALPHKGSEGKLYLPRQRKVREAIFSFSREGNYV
jgi:hypothetical protein